MERLNHKGIILDFVNTCTEKFVWSIKQEYIHILNIQCNICKNQLCVQSQKNIPRSWKPLSHNSQDNEEKQAEKPKARKTNPYSHEHQTYPNHLGNSKSISKWFLD